MHATEPTAIGHLLRDWRTRRRLSQQALAEAAEVSTRHISYVENGRSAPSRQMVLILSSALDIPLRERNLLLSAAGFAPVYRESSLEEAAMAPVNRAIDFVCAAHDPFPVLVVDEKWDLVRMNTGAQRVAAHFVDPHPELVPVMGNAMHLTFHPRGLRRFIRSWDESARTILERLHLEARIQPSSERLLSELLEYPDIPSDWRRGAHHPELTFEVTLERGDVRLRTFSLLTSLGTAVDVTASSLKMETWFPADAATEAWFRAG